MKKVLSIALFLAAAGIGFTLLPSCGGGKGEDGSAKGVITVNDLKRGRKFFRIYHGGTWMDVKPQYTTDTPELDSDEVASVECTVVLDQEYPGRITGYSTSNENEEGVPDSATFELFIDPDNFLEFMQSGGLPWQFFVGIGSSGDDDAWSSFAEAIRIRINSFQGQIGEMHYALKYVKPPADDPNEYFDLTGLRIEVYSNR